jgi:hypothetical protein
MSLVPGVLPSASMTRTEGRKWSRVGTTVNLQTHTPLTSSPFESEGIQVSSGDFGALLFLRPNRGRRCNEAGHGSFKQPQTGL